MQQKNNGRHTSIASSYQATMARQDPVEITTKKVKNHENANDSRCSYKTGAK